MQTLVKFGGDGVHKSNRGGGWQSPANLFEALVPGSEALAAVGLDDAAAQDVAHLSAQIVAQGHAFVEAFSQAAGVRPSDFGVRVVASWANANGPGGWNAPHEHDGDISGVVYIDAGASVDESGGADESGSTGTLVLSDPRPHAFALATPTRGRATLSTLAPGTDLQVSPSSGLYVMFPSWLRHHVTSHQRSTRQRLAISFNLEVVPVGSANGPSGDMSSRIDRLRQLMRANESPQRAVPSLWSSPRDAMVETTTHLSLRLQRLDRVSAATTAVAPRQFSDHGADGAGTIVVPGGGMDLVWPTPIMVSGLDEPRVLAAAGAVAAAAAAAGEAGGQEAASAVLCGEEGEAGSDDNMKVVCATIDTRIRQFVRAAEGHVPAEAAVDVRFALSATTLLHNLDMVEPRSHARMAQQGALPMAQPITPTVSAVMVLGGNSDVAPLLRLEDPRGLSDRGSHFGIDRATAARSIPLTPGLLVLFPAWMPFHVDPLLSSASSDGGTQPYLALLQAAAAVSV